MTEYSDPTDLIPEVSFLLACKDDLRSLEFVISELLEAESALRDLCQDIRIVVVDDSTSNDLDSLQQTLAAQIARRTSLFKVEIVPGPRAGLSAAILHGLSTIHRRNSNSWIVNLDGDGQHDVRASTDLIRLTLFSDLDCVIGSRWVRGGEAPGLRWTRALMSRTSACIYHFAGIPREVKDPTTSFRCYRPAAVRLVLSEVRSFRGFSFFPAAIAALGAADLRIGEVPITFRPRVYGHSKLSGSIIWTSLKEIPRIWSLTRMIKLRARWFRESEGRYVGVEELQALRSATRFQRYAMSISADSLRGQCLEIGSGVGTSARPILEHLRGREGAHLLLYEPDSELRASLSHLENEFYGLTRVVDDLGEVRAHSVDTILLYSVLEHIADDREFLASLQHFLNPASEVILMVPRMPSIYGKIDGTSGHYRRYDKSSVFALAEGSGFEVSRIRALDSIGWIPYLVRYSLLGGGSISTTVVRLNELVMVPTIKVLDRVLPRLGVASKNLVVHLRLVDPV